MSITINDIVYDYVEHETISELLHRLNFRFPLIIVKINGTFIPRDRFVMTSIPDHAMISIIHMISGG